MFLPTANRRGSSTGALAVLLLVSVLSGCGLFVESEPEPVDMRWTEGIRALDTGNFQTAEERFQHLASRCESGAEGRSALLALTTMHLDLRNPDGRPDEAARFAAIHLNVPDAPAAERSLARTLYLLSIYRGADPVEGPEELEPGRNGVPRAPLTEAAEDTMAAAADGGVVAPVPVEDPAPEAVVGREPGMTGPIRDFAPARRFSECDVAAVEWRGVPDYPGTPPSRWTASDTVLIRDPGAAGRAAALQARVNELEAELARIRKLLKGGGGEVPKLRP